MGAAFVSILVLEKQDFFSLRKKRREKKKVILILALFFLKENKGRCVGLDLLLLSLLLPRSDVSRQWQRTSAGLQLWLRSEGQASDAKSACDASFFFFFTTPYCHVLALCV